MKKEDAYKKLIDYWITHPEDRRGIPKELKKYISLEEVDLLQRPYREYGGKMSDKSLRELKNDLQKDNNNHANKTKIIIIVLLLLFLLAYAGIINFTGKANVLGIEINVPFLISENKNYHSIGVVPFNLNNLTNFSIYNESIANKKEIYEIGEIFNVSFSVINTLNSSYNISVDWILDNNSTRFLGWKNVSTNFVQDSEYSANYWSSSPNLTIPGKYKIQILIKSNSNQSPLTYDKVLFFQVA